MDSIHHFDYVRFVTYVSRVTHACSFHHVPVIMPACARFIPLIFAYALGDIPFRVDGDEGAGACRTRRFSISSEFDFSERELRIFVSTFLNVRGFHPFECEAHSPPATPVLAIASFPMRLSARGTDRGSRELGRER